MKLQEWDDPVLQRAGFTPMRELRPHLTDDAAFGIYYLFYYSRARS